MTCLCTCLYEFSFFEYLLQKSDNPQFRTYLKVSRGSLSFFKELEEKIDKEKINRGFFKERLYGKFEIKEIEKIKKESIVD